jgi:hypothetical protein
MVTKLYSGAEVTIPQPDEGFGRPTLQLGATARTLDGTLKRHTSGLKRRWGLVWSHLDSTDLATLMGQLEEEGDLTFLPPDEGTTYTVLVVGEIGVRATMYGWTVNATLEEV